MKLLDDLAVSDDARWASRRRFLSLTTLGALGAAMAGSFAISLRFLWPSVLFEAPSRFIAGRVAQLLRRPILFLRNRRIYIVKDERGAFAQSAVCTHLGCLTRPNTSSDGFFCPCHGSRFQLDGTVVKGPAVRPLPHFALERREDDLWVDMAREEDDSDARVQV